MKIFYKVSVIFLFALFLSACGQATLMAPTPVILTYTPVPTLTPAPSSTSTPTTTSPYAIKPTKTPTITSTPFVDFLEDAFSIQDLDSVNEHSLRKITGWDDGIYSFEWMDSGYLLMYPIVEKILTASGKVNELYLYPVVIDLSSAETWFPSSKKIADRGLLYWSKRNLYQPVWSEELEVLISIQKKGDEYSVVVYSADGDVVKVYDKEIIDLSPSGTKLMLRDGTWIDLKSEKTIRFEWDEYQQ